MLLSSFHIARKILVTFAILAKFADFTKPFLASSYCKCRILLNLLFLLFFAIFVAASFHIARKILVTFAIFAKFAAFTKLFLSFSLCKSRILKNLLFLLFSPYLLLNLLTYSKKNSSYFCDFCDICYFFSIFLIAVFFKSFFAKIAKTIC